MKKPKKHGGTRKGAGRKKKEPTKTIRVPVATLSQIEKIVLDHKKKSEK